MEMLGRDALAVLDAAKVEKTDWCGLSMGGMVGMWLGASAPGRVNRLILSNTSAYFENKQIWNDRIALVREKGLTAVVQGTIERWFTQAFREREPQKVKTIAEMFLAAKPEGYIACGQAVRDMDHREIIRAVTAPTLIIAGRYDPATTLEMGELIRSRIPGAALTILDAAHLSNIEQPHEYADTALGFLLQK
jgi:3-oxoadipate enol-lactonase